MPLLKASDPLPKRPVIIVIYGDPAVGKTTLINTAKNPLLIDADRGKDRAILRKDTLVVYSWDDILAEEKSGLFKDYNTIGIDTPKAILDDFLMSWVQNNDFKLKKNKLQAYGAIGDEFKVFLSNRRSEDSDIVIVCHSKKEKEGDITTTFPDVTGQSYALLMRIADQVGYYAMRNNKRTILWDPTDTSVGKNVAKLPLTEVPGEGDPALKTFMAGIIDRVKEAISRQSEAQQEALEKMEKFSKEIAGIDNVDHVNMMIPVIQQLPKVQKDALLKVLGEKAKEKGYQWVKEKAAFIDPAPASSSKKGKQEASEPVELEVMGQSDGLPF